MIKDSDGKVRFYGVYRGVVADIRDPLSKNRIRVQVPQVLSGEVTGWAWPIAPTSSGRVAIPKIGEGVFISFEGGDPSFPLWTGLFSGTSEDTGGLDGGSANTDLFVDGGTASSTY